MAPTRVTVHPPTALPTSGRVGRCATGIEVTTPAGSLKFKLLSLAAKELWVFRARCAKLYGQMAAEPERSHAKPQAEPEAVGLPVVTRTGSDDTAAGTSLAGAFKFSPGLPAVERGKVPSGARPEGALEISELEASARDPKKNADKSKQHESLCENHFIYVQSSVYWPGLWEGT
jgi:hypothetical protein